MSEQVRVDSLEFARSAKSLQGSFEIADLDRLHDRLAAMKGKLAYGLTGYTDDKGKPGLRLEVSGTLELACQRCLQPLEWPVDLAADLLLVVTEAELTQEGEEPDSPDRLLADKDMDVRLLVEDEVLLALPIAPKHPEGRCSAASGQGEPQASHPFAELARLKQTGR